MVINWYGEGCFRVQTGGVTLLTDPFDREAGLTPPRFRADIVLRTLSSAGEVKFGSDAASSGFEISGPGEYEAKGIEILGYPLSRGSEGAALRTTYTVAAEGMRIGFLGHLTAAPDAGEMENLESADILVVPAGGKPYLDQEAAAKLVRQIAPKIVIPSFYKVPGLARRADELKEFLRELAVEGRRGVAGGAEEKLTIRKNDLPQTLTVAALAV